MGQIQDELFAKGKPMSKKAQLELRMQNPVVQMQTEEIKQKYRKDTENILRKKKKKKKEATIDDIILGVKNELVRKDSFDNFEKGIGTVSASKLTTFRGCHFSYLMQYGLHLPMPIYFPHLVYGECMHKVLENFNLDNLRTFEELIWGRDIIIEENGKPKKEKIKGWRAQWYGSANSLDILWRNKAQMHIDYDRGVKMLAGFFEKEKDKPKPNKNLVERKFNLVLDCNPYLNAYYRIRGVFDKIDVDGDKITITDYKTGSAGDVSTDMGLQLTLYWYAYNKLADDNEPHFPKPKKPEDLRLVLYPMSTLEEKSTTRSAVDMKYLINEIYNADSDVKNKNFSPYIGALHCDKMCWWQDTCHDVLTANNKEVFDLLISPYLEKIKQNNPNL